MGFHVHSNTFATHVETLTDYTGYIDYSVDFRILYNTRRTLTVRINAKPLYYYVIRDKIFDLPTHAIHFWQYYIGFSGFSLIPETTQAHMQRLHAQWTVEYSRNENADDNTVDGVTRTPSDITRWPLNTNRDIFFVCSVEFCSPILWKLEK